MKYFDFEFEQYTLDNDILKDMILDEIIMANCKEAREANRHLRMAHEDEGVLERIYDRSDESSKKRTKSTERKKISTLPLDISYTPETTEKSVETPPDSNHEEKKQVSNCQGLKIDIPEVAMKNEKAGEKSAVSIPSAFTQASSSVPKVYGKSVFSSEKDEEMED